MHSKEVFLRIRTRIYPSIVLRRTRAAARVGGSEEGGGCCSSSSSTFSKVCDSLKAAAWDFGLVWSVGRVGRLVKKDLSWACARRPAHCHSTKPRYVPALWYIGKSCGNSASNVGYPWSEEDSTFSLGKKTKNLKLAKQNITSISLHIPNIVQA